MRVIPRSRYETYSAVRLIAGHVDAADCSVTRLIWQAAEALAWFVIWKTVKIREKKTNTKSGMFCFFPAN